MGAHLDSKLASKIPIVVYPLCHVGRVSGGMLVITMTRQKTVRVRVR